MSDGVIGVGRHRFRIELPGADTTGKKTTTTVEYDTKLHGGHCVRENVRWVGLTMNDGVSNLKQVNMTSRK